MTLPRLVYSDMTFSKHFLVAILQGVLVTLLSLLVQAQDREEFISIDCGISDVSSYTDEKTNIVYSSDATFVETGLNRVISPAYKMPSQDQQLWNLRFFPEGIRNCYALKHGLDKGDKYLIRARFLYGNYDDENRTPSFDLHLGVDLWGTVAIQDAITTQNLEIIHVLTSDHIDVCLVNTGNGTPFISALEVRPIEDDNLIYSTEAGSLQLYGRYAFSLSPANEVTRFEDDAYDRLWEQLGRKPFIKGTSTNENSITKNLFRLPFVVMNTAYVSSIDPRSLEITWSTFDRVNSYKLYFHFMELETLQANQSREFNIFINGALWYPSVIPRYLSENSMYNKEAGDKFESGKLEISLNSTANSTLPPIISALEIYMIKELSRPETNQNDVEAISSIKAVYKLNRLRWQGDPCVPEDYQWDGLNCSYTANNSPRIVSLNLSSSGLKGVIAPSIANLTFLQNLDLSNNNLSGVVPEFLAQLLFLNVLNLNGNNFTGPIPDALFKRKKNGLLLSIDTNSSSSSNPCSSKSCGKKRNFVVPVVASLSGLLFVCFVTVAIIWGLKRRHRKAPKISQGKSLESEGNEEGEYNNKTQRYTYSEIRKATNNFGRVLGEGGFGKVYHAYLNGIEVAVKLLSSSSLHGLRQFQAELKLLLRVHHKNLTTLVGYFNEGSEVGLIYEYMAMGDLHSHLSGNRINGRILSWKQRLQIAVDTAQGLEYLHNGCKPRIIHRDVKSTNILLNEKFRAKLGDFGFSKDFAIDGNNHTSLAGISASVVGTPGYLDPEYHKSNRLSAKSDVYSFGIVLLEIITARPVVAKTRQKNHIIEWVSSMIAKGDIKGILDPRLNGDTVDINSVWRLIEISMACVSDASTDRPTMSRVALDLKECLTTNMARNKNHDETHDATNLDEIISTNMALESPLAR